MDADDDTNDATGAGGGVAQAPLDERKAATGPSTLVGSKSKPAFEAATAAAASVEDDIAPTSSTKDEDAASAAAASAEVEARVVVADSGHAEKEGSVVVLLSEGDCPPPSGRTKTETEKEIIEEEEDMTIGSTDNTNQAGPLDDGDTPMNLSPQAQPEPDNDNHVPMNLCNKDVVNLSGLSAKMRLKKQRLLEAEAAASVNGTSTSSTDVDSPASVLMAMKNSHMSQLEHQNSALHRLAEAAERKQEEEMMEIESSTPTPSGSPQTYTPPPPLKLLGHRRLTTGALNLAPHTEFEVATSPLLSTRNHHFKATATPSPDSAIHSATYSPTQSPVQARHPISSISSPFSHRTTPSLSRNNSDASQYSQSSATTSPLSPSQFSPSQSPVQGRNPGGFSSYPPSPHQPARHLSLPTLYHHGLVVTKSTPEDLRRSSPMCDIAESNGDDSGTNVAMASANQANQGISRQQLINSPCPICGDKISGFHYGIFSCESCKGFFKRTVQNKKNYVCLRGAQCPVSIATRKKCPACRFEKCLKTGMKLEAIREDRTRGGRSTYHCSYTIPAGLCPSPGQGQGQGQGQAQGQAQGSGQSGPVSLPSAQQPTATPMSTETNGNGHVESAKRKPAPVFVPALLQEIMDVEHLWFSGKPFEAGGHWDSPKSDRPGVQTLTLMADKRLYKLVKWCKSLPLFKNILIDDQITLLINAWCELLVFSCCYRSVATPGLIKVSNERSLDLRSAKKFGVENCIEKMLNFTEQLRRLRVDYYEYVSLKVIVLLTSDASGLKEPEHVRDSQEKVLQSLQQYTNSNFPEMPSKFGELLLRMPELHRVCQVGKEMLCPRDDGGTGFNLLMELLRGDH